MAGPVSYVRGLQTPTNFAPSHTDQAAAGYLYNNYNGERKCYFSQIFLLLLWTLYKVYAVLGEGICKLEQAK